MLVQHNVKGNMKKNCTFLQKLRWLSVKEENKIYSLVN